MPILTQNELHRLLHYDPDSGTFTHIANRGRWYGAGKLAGTKTHRGYINICIKGKTYGAHRLAWLYVRGYMPELIIDHINRNPSDNRICNLREVSQQCNMRNRRQNSNNTSGIRGVYFKKQTGRWKAAIIHNQSEKHLGYFSDFTEAVAHRLAAEQCLNWAGCDSNSPAYQHMHNYLNFLKGV